MVHINASKRIGENKMKTVYLVCSDKSGRKRHMMSIQEGQTNLVLNICFSASTPAEMFYRYFNCFVDSAKLLCKKENNLEIYEYNLGSLDQREMGIHLIRAMNSPKFLEGETSGYAWL